MVGKLISRILWVLFVGAALFLGWRVYEKKMRSALPPGIASGNGRIEAIQVDVSAKEPGRIAKILAHEGDLVEPDQVVARMDIATLEAELARGNANVATSQEKATVVKSSIVRRESELKLAETEFARVKNLFSRKFVSREEYDQKDAMFKTAQALLEEEKAKLNTALQSVEVDKAEVKHTQTRIDDSVLKSPVKGRVLYRLAEEGEVLASGGKVLTLLNLEDVYMDPYLPGQEAARIKYGDEARIVLDAAPGRVAPAKVRDWHQISWSFGVTIGLPPFAQTTGVSHGVQAPSPSRLCLPLPRLPTRSAKRHHRGASGHQSTDRHSG